MKKKKYNYFIICIWFFFFLLVFSILKNNTLYQEKLLRRLSSIADFFFILLSLQKRNNDMFKQHLGLVTIKIQNQIEKGLLFFSREKRWVCKRRFVWILRNCCKHEYFVFKIYRIFAFAMYKRDFTVKLSVCLINYSKHERVGWLKDNGDRFHLVLFFRINFSVKYFSNTSSLQIIVTKKKKNNC